MISELLGLFVKAGAVVVPWLGFKADFMNIALAGFILLSLAVLLVAVPVSIAGRRGWKYAEGVYSVAALASLALIGYAAWVFGGRSGVVGFVAGGFFAALAISMVAAPSMFVIWCLDIMRQRAKA